MNLESTIYRQLEAEEKPLYLAGCDEAGRGSFAGPLVAAAVILPIDIDLPGVTDSKKIKKSRHRDLAKEILAKALAVSIQVATVSEINKTGIHAANAHAIERAVKSLSITPSYVLIDGDDNLPVRLEIPNQHIPGGDGTCLSISAASILAKAIHDILLADAAAKYPEYGWMKNAGYGTPEHLKAIETFGLCPEHRVDYKPIRRYLANGGHFR